MKKPRMIVFASGTKTGGGSGFENLVIASRAGIFLDADIVAAVSNHESGGVDERAHKLKIPFIHFPGPFTEEGYRGIIKGFDFDFIALSGWLKLVLGLDPRITFNIHPGPLPESGGPGMHGHHVHEAVLEAYRRKEIFASAVSMHFVTDEYDKGPVFFRYPVIIHPTDSVDDLAKRVNRAEHAHQPSITNMVVHGEISWDGKDPRSLRVPSNYPYLSLEVCA